MNSKVKAGFSFGVAMALFFIIDTLLTSDNLTAKKTLTLIIFGLFAGAISGLLFGWLMGKFASSKFINDKTKIDIDAGENLIFQTPANHFKGAEGVGGKLYLTDKRLIFKSHKLNIQNHELTISLSDVMKVDKYKPLGLTNNGLSIRTAKQKTEKFVVEKVDEWISYLQNR